MASSRSADRRRPAGCGGPRRAPASARGRARRRPRRCRSGSARGRRRARARADLSAPSDCVDRTDVRGSLDQATCGRVGTTRRAGSYRRRCPSTTSDAPPPAPCVRARSSWPSSPSRRSAACSGWTRRESADSRSATSACFVFVLGGWVVSVCLHEFAHAFAAYRAGDRSVEAARLPDAEPVQVRPPAAVDRAAAVLHRPGRHRPARRGGLPAPARVPHRRAAQPGRRRRAR